MSRKYTILYRLITKMTTVFTDGGALNNGKRNCSAAWAVFFNDDHPLNESGPILVDPSNQKAELFAIHEALKKTKDQTHVTIITDSKYSIDCLTKWCKAWERNGWKTSKNEPVKHLRLIKDSIELTKDRNIIFKHVNSHRVPPADKTSLEYQTWYGNFMVDKMVGKELASNVPPKWVQPKGKAVEIDWDGNIKEIENDVIDKKQKEKVEEPNTVEVRW